MNYEMGRGEPFKSDLVRVIAYEDISKVASFFTAGAQVNLRAETSGSAAVSDESGGHVFTVRRRELRFYCVTTRVTASGQNGKDRNPNRKANEECAHEVPS